MSFVKNISLRTADSGNYAWVDAQTMSITVMENNLILRFRDQGRDAQPIHIARVFRDGFWEYQCVSVHAGSQQMFVGEEQEPYKTRMNRTKEAGNA
jgi:hypothetical protein